MNIQFSGSLIPASGQMNMAKLMTYFFFPTMAKVPLYSRIYLTYIGSHIMPNASHTCLYLYKVGLQIKKTEKQTFFPFTLANNEIVH
jgi:hypothetical protein